MDFVFYDLETTGLSPAFDQPLQFAAIYTDENFVEKDRVNIRCRLAPHILPSPQALVVTRVNRTLAGVPNCCAAAQQLGYSLKCGDCREHLQELSETLNLS
jgi:exonuclease I